MNTPAAEVKIAQMFDRIAYRYDFLNSLLSLRQDRLWRSHLIKRLPKSKLLKMLDVATGTGDVLLNTALKKDNINQYVGIDISEKMLAGALLKQKEWGLQDKNIIFKQMSAMDLKFADASFDVVTISFGLRNVVDKKRAIEEFYRVLKPNGQLFILEFFHGEQGILSGGFKFYFKNILPKIGGLLSDKKAYRYLPDSVETFYSLDELDRLIKTSGFSNEYNKKFLFGSCHLLQYERKNRLNK